MMIIKEIMKKNMVKKYIVWNVLININASTNKNAEANQNRNRN